jgi:hypothetical protein
LFRTYPLDVAPTARGVTVELLSPWVEVCVVVKVGKKLSDMINVVSGVGSEVVVDLARVRVTVNTGTVTLVDLCRKLKHQYIAP